jgi:hypothetical protein
LDPGFALAYWELARFWTTQTQTTNIGSGIVEMSLEEVTPLFDDAIDKAIEHESDPVNQIRSRVLKATEHLRLRQALRLNTAYLSQRPNDQIAQNAQLDLLADLNIDDRLKSTIAEFQERGGYDVVVSNNSMTYSLISNDKPFIRAVAKTALERIGDSTFVVYQAHRSLLWAGDIDGASRLMPILRSSDLPEESRQLVALRQACAEGRHSDAARIYDRLNSDFPDDFSIIWISNRIMSQDERAFETLIQIDEMEDLRSMRDYLAYAFFDARPFPNLMALLESQDVEPRAPREIPYRCKL